MAEHQSSSSESDQKKRLQLLDQLDDIFSCAICLMNLDNPHLCSQCSKLYCYDCISGWLQSESEQHLYCPNCKNELQLDKLVKVRWFEEAEKLRCNFLEPTASTSSTNKATKSSNEETNDVDGGTTVSNGDAVKKDVCSKHLKTLKLYCCNCKLCICDECAVTNDDHPDHTYKNLDVIYESDMQILEEELKKVKDYIDRIVPLVDEVDFYVELVNKTKDEKIKEVQSFAKNAIEGLERQANEMQQKLKSNTSALTTEMQSIEQKLELMKTEVTASSRPQLIAEKSRIAKECNKILKKPIKNLGEIRVPFSLKVDIPTIFDTGILVIENYSSLQNVYKLCSNDFTDSFDHTWRIVMYIYKSECQLGIFLELVKGHPCRMEGDIHLLHPEPKYIIKWQFNYTFNLPASKTVGRKFASLETISERYLKDDDSLEVLYHIRPYGGTDSGNGK